MNPVGSNKSEIYAGLQASRASYGMKNLLIITQRVDRNYDVLSFFVEWIAEFSKKFEKVTVICLKMGEYALPDNVKVLSLGKERRVSKFSYLWNFCKYIWQERNNYDAVFIHNNPRYVLLGWPIWRILGKKISLWYAHGHVPLMLKIADKLVDIAFTSTEEGYRLNSDKLKIMGQGIDTGLFKPAIYNQSLDMAQDEQPMTDRRLIKVVSAGRISPSKDYETLIGAIKLLTDENVYIEIAGQPAIKSDEGYLIKLNTKIKESGLTSRFVLVGPIINKELPKFLQSADIFVNMSHTGSLDKAVLEAMACGLPVLTCNEALRGVLGPYANELVYPVKDDERLANGLRRLIAMSGEERKKLGLKLRDRVVRNHSLPELIKSMSELIKLP